VQNTKVLPSCATALERAVRLAVELRNAQSANARFRIRHEIEHILAFEAGKKFGFDALSIDDGFHVKRHAR